MRTELDTKVSHRIFTIPNLLSLIRLILVPVFFVLFVVEHNDLLAFIVFMVAAATDWIDGLVARATNSVSRLGQMIDPLIDRVLIFVGVISVYLVGRVPLWIVLILVLRDGVMLLLTIHIRRRYNRDFKVIFLGKLTTAVLMTGFCGLVLYWPVIAGARIIESDLLPGWGTAVAPLGIWFIYLGVIISLITAGIYLYKGTREDDGLQREKAGK